MKGPWIRIGLLSAAVLGVAGCRSYDTNPRDPPDQPSAVQEEAEEPGTGGSGSSNTSDAAGRDPKENRGEDLADEELDPSAVVR